MAVDNVLVDGSTIGHSANASLMTLSGTKIIVDGGIEVNSLTLGSEPITATADDINILASVNVDANKINYLSDVNSNIQTQINNRLTETQADGLYASINGGSDINTVGTLTSGSIGNNFGAINTLESITTTDKITGSEVKVSNVTMKGSTIGHTDKTDLLTFSTSGLSVDGSLTTSGQATVNSLRLGTVVITASGNDINKLKDVTSTAAELNILNGVTGVTSTKIGYLTDVTSNIQAQITSN